jgi:prolyl 4-hydroxylase
MTIQAEILTSFVVSTDPKIAIVPGFLTPDECETLITLAESIGFTRSLVGRGSYSTDTDDKSSSFENQFSDNRTSSSVHLSPTLYTTLLAPIKHRLSALIKMPTEHLEDLILVKYEEGQFFKPHHDGLFRPYTVFIYLNDLPPDGGGETRFPQLGLRIRPRKGAAVVWKNSMDVESPLGTIRTVEDTRLVHEALPPVGVKYGVNCFFNEHPTSREQL